MVTQRGFIRGDKIHKVLEDLSDEYVFKKDPMGYYSVYNRTISPHPFTGHLVFKSVRPDTYSVRELTNNDRFIHRLDEAIKRHGGGIEVEELFSSPQTKITGPKKIRKKRGVWKKIGVDMYERNRNNIIYVDNYKNGYTVKYGQAAINYKLFKTKKEAFEEMERLMEFL